MIFNEPAKKLFDCTAIDDISPDNPFRMKANEELYDAFKEHTLNRVSSFGTIPDKSEIDFIKRPFNWK